MKIIRQRPARRPEWGEALMRKPQKKALLVGIQYERDAEEGDEEGANALCGPHKDVAEMRQLLIDHYSYAPEDIVVLVDTDEPGQVQPTRENMLRAIDTLIEEAAPGDHFFFHYAGHAVQVENRNFSEEDGMDECIIPSDGETRMIKDNELRRHLVDPLPVGSNLVAVFDSCHSASLLDLDHFRCNRPYVPWISKGRRRSDSRWNANVRQHALYGHYPFNTKRITKTNFQSKITSIDEILISSAKEYKKLTLRTHSLSCSKKLEWYDSPSEPIRRTTSPDSMWPCTGYCPPSSPHEANVIALSACKDYQLSWEDSEGASMTKALVNILREDPHPNLKDLMTTLSHELHTFYLRLHSHAREYRRKVRNVNKKRQARGLPPITSPVQPPEMNNFQDPQLSSHRPLPPGARWDP